MRVKIIPRDDRKAMRAPPAPQSIPDSADALLLLEGRRGLALTHRGLERHSGGRSLISCTNQAGCPGGVGWASPWALYPAPVLIRAGELSPSPGPKGTQNYHPVI